MKVVNVWFAEGDLESLDRLIPKWYPNRNEAIRIAVRDLIRFHLGKEVVEVERKP